MSVETEVAAQKPVPAVISEIARSTLGLWRAITTLEKALAPVLAPEPPQGVDEKEKPVDSPTLVQTLSEHNTQLEALRSHVKAIQSRLEV